MLRFVKCNAAVPYMIFSIHERWRKANENAEFIAPGRRCTFCLSKNRIDHRVKMMHLIATAKR